MKIAVNKAHFPVTVLGPGRRIGIWLQGCSLRCKGCISQDTWAPDPGREMTVAQLLSWCRESTGGVFDGVTISGGEPFDQPKALSALLDAFLHWRQNAKLEFDILCYSGYPWHTLQKRHPRILGRLDALIPEPFVEALPMTRKWCGSANQSLHLLSDRGRKRYATADPGLDGPEKRMQLMVDGHHVWYIGIPARGDMEALEQACRAPGLNFSQVSWRQ